MPLEITLFSAPYEDEAEELGTALLATTPTSGAGQPVYFGRESGTLRREAGQHRVLATEDGEVSRLQGTVWWDGSRAVIRNQSENRELVVREWASRGRALGRKAAMVVSSGRAVVDIPETDTYLVIHPRDPFERGWAKDPVGSRDSTPQTWESVRSLLRPVFVCACRATRTPTSMCGDALHTPRERDLATVLAGGQPYSTWQRPRRHALEQRGGLRQVASGLGVSPSGLTRRYDALYERMREVVDVPRMSEGDLLCWLAARYVFTFDEVADIVTDLTR